MDLSNEAYYLLDSNIKKLNEIIENAQTDYIHAKHLDSINNGQFMQKHYEELMDFENFLNSTFL
jgi:hypothetical protein